MSRLLTILTSAAESFAPVSLTWRMWLTGETLGADASAIATWEDETANNNNATQGTAGNRPAVDADGVNSLPAAVFTGGDFLDAPSITPTGATSAGQYTKFAVFQLDTIVSASNNLLSGTTNGHAWRIFDSSGAGLMRVTHGANATNISSPTLATGTVYVGMVTYDPVLDRHNIYLDGAWIGATTTPGTISDNSLNVGAFADANTLEGRIAVAGIRQGVLSGDGQYQLHTWALRYKSITASLRRVIGIGGSWMRGGVTGNEVTGVGTTGGDTLLGQTFALLGLTVDTHITAQNSGVSSQSTTDLLAATTAYQFYTARAQKRVCIYWVTSNDLDAGTSPATVWTNIQTQINRLIGCGYAVLVLPVLPRTSSNGNYETDRQTLNTSISGGVGALGATYVDVFAGGGSILDDSGIINNATYYYGDQIHIRAAAYALIAANVAPALSAVL